MSTSIGSSYGFSSMQRPDPTQMANKLFSKLDTKSQGYLEKSDLQSAMEGISSSSGSNVDELFAKLDSDSDGKVTQNEMSETLSKLAEQLSSQFNQMRMQGGMPPPPPPQGGDDAGFTKDELTSQLQEIGSSDSQRASLISDIVENFDAADTDGDGKVSFQEAMAYEQQNSTSTGASTATGETDETASSEARLMQQIMQLMHAYGGKEDSEQNALSALISTSA